MRYVPADEARFGAGSAASDAGLLNGGPAPAVAGDAAYSPLATADDLVDGGGAPRGDSAAVAFDVTAAEAESEDAGGAPTAPS
ncbi:hypothetical protein [Rhizohabitans arisaemae]|uniref:hypothetical protein n=1 Tax=Rhizohabitans arisaemae TaxID=2720610 RepID=UPI0024B14DC6|nr:hypothetical protein [Rhizohabitans arisaemae]